MLNELPHGDPPLSSAKEATVRLAEYATLRAEILKRFEMHFQLLSLAIVAAGTLLFTGVQSADRRVGAVLVLSYPFLAFLLGSVWGHSDRRISQLGAYIRTQIEPRLGKDAQGRMRMEWEGHHVGSKVRPRLYHFAMSWIFVGTQLFLIAIAVVVMQVDPFGMLHEVLPWAPATLSNPVLSMLFVFALLCVVSTLYATRHAPRDV